MAIVVAIYAGYSLLRDRQRRQRGLVVPPWRLTALKIAGAAAAGIAIVLVINQVTGYPFTS